MINYQRVISPVCVFVQTVYL